jgi:hypothetical protein
LGTTNGLSLSTQQLSLGLASSSANGALSSTDWTTFNNKQNALTNPVTGTGTTNYLPKFTGASTIGNSQVFDNGTSVGINTPTPSGSWVLDVWSNNATWNTRLYQASTLNTAYNSLFIEGAMTGAKAYFGIGGSATGNTSFRDSVVIGSLSSHPLVFNTADAEKMRLTIAGNLGIATPNPVAADGSSVTLQLRSTVVLQNVIGIQSLFANNAYYDGSLKRVSASGAVAAMRINADSGQNGISFHVAPSGAANSAISNWDSSDIKMRINNSGNVGIGTTSPFSKLDVAGALSINGRPILDNSSAELYIGGITGVSGRGTDVVALYTANTERMRITSAGRVLIGTPPPTESTFTLDVNGTGRSSVALTAN